MAIKELEIIGWEAAACDAEHVHLDLFVKDHKEPVRLVFINPDGAYGCAKSMTRAFDDAIGVE